MTYLGTRIISHNLKIIAQEATLKITCWNMPGQYSQSYSLHLLISFNFKRFARSRRWCHVQCERPFTTSLLLPPSSLPVGPILHSRRRLTASVIHKEAYRRRTAGLWRGSLVLPYLFFEVMSYNRGSGRGGCVHVFGFTHPACQQVKTSQTVIYDCK